MIDPEPWIVGFSLSEFTLSSVIRAIFSFLIVDNFVINAITAEPCGGCGHQLYGFNLNVHIGS